MEWKGKWMQLEFRWELFCSICPPERDIGKLHPSSFVHAGSERGCACESAVQHVEKCNAFQVLSSQQIRKNEQTSHFVENIVRPPSLIPRHHLNPRSQSGSNPQCHPEPANSQFHPHAHPASLRQMHFP